MPEKFWNIKRKRKYKHLRARSESKVRDLGSPSVSRETSVVKVVEDICEKLKKKYLHLEYTKNQLINQRLEGVIIIMPLDL